MGLRHDLEQIRVFNDDGTINELGGKYQGLTTKQARKEIVKDLEELGLLEKIEDHMHNVGTCYRCSTTVEPLTSLQWFVKMEPLAKPAIDAVSYTHLDVYKRQSFALCTLIPVKSGMVTFSKEESSTVRVIVFEYVS